MTKRERITKKVEADKGLMKQINNETYSGVDYFIDNAIRYIKAIKEGRVVCCIDTVSKSGMSRTIKFLECAKTKGRNEYHYNNFSLLFRLLGYNPDQAGYSRIHGCGMDMIFHTNYTIIHQLRRLGFLSYKQTERLAQNTPPVI